MSAMQQMNTATQSMQQTTQTTQQIINSFPSDAKSVGDQDVCTVATDCGFAYIMIFLLIAFTLFVVFLTPIQTWYESWKEKRTNKKP